MIAKSSRAVVVIVMVLGVVLAGVSSAYAAEKSKRKGPKMRVAVVDFRDEFSGVGTHASGQGSAFSDALNAFTNLVNKSYPGAGVQTVGAGATKMLETALVQSGNFDVYTRVDLDKVLKEQALGMTGAVTAQSAAKAGQLVGVSGVVVGAVTEFGEKVKGVSMLGLVGSRDATARVVIDVQIIDTTTGQIVKALSAEGEETNVGVSLALVSGGTSLDDTKVGKAMRKAVNKLVEDLKAEMANTPWSAKIVKADGNTVIINAGSSGDMQQGMTLQVYKAGEELIDPDTGASLGKEETMAGEIMITQVSEKTSKATIKRGSGFAAGDVVRMK